MNQKLWQKNNQLNSLIEMYTSGEDISLDQNLIEFDIYGSLAHAQMLSETGLIEISDYHKIKSVLLQLFDKNKHSKYILNFGDEDVHTRIENDLTAIHSQAGAKLHTGRSRNDQVLVDIRLFSKKTILEVSHEVVTAGFHLLDQAKKFEHIPLPGMTHMQPAMISSVGLWLAALAESLLDDLKMLETAYELNDQSPLGSGAAYGVSLPINRYRTAELLGFKKVQNNALYCQNSKGKIEGITLTALTQVMATLNKFASDCLLFTTEPFSFFNFDKNLGTGSSIMPQKHNWDALELMRAKYHQLLSYQLQLGGTLSNLPSGYNRDLQQTKQTLISGFNTTLQSLQVFDLFVYSLQINSDQIRQHLPKELCAAHWTYELMREKKWPFRQAYHYVKEHLNEIPNFDITTVLKQSSSQGGPGNLGLEFITKDLEKYKQKWLRKSQNFNQTLNQLISH